MINQKHRVFANTNRTNTLFINKCVKIIQYEKMYLSIFIIYQSVLCLL